MDLKSRISAYCKIKNLAISKFESLAGLSNGYFNQVKKRPSKEKLDNIKNVFPDLNIEWLLTGEGEMLRENGQNTAQNVENMSSIESFLREQLKEKDSEIKELSRRIGQLEAENRLLRERRSRDTAASGADSAVAG